MRRLIVAPQARRDIANALAISLRQFGREAAARYRLLFDQAYADLCNDPERAGVAPLRNGGAHHLYHLRHARLRMSRENRVAAPRHVVAFIFNDRAVEIVRVLHDAMNLESQLEDENGE